MKITGTVFRIFVGLLFMFSGFIKFNDPLGFSYKMEEYFDVFSTDLKVSQDSIHIQIEDAMGYSVRESFEGNKNIKNKKIQINTQTQQDFIETEMDSIPGTDVYVSIDNNLVYRETHTYDQILQDNFIKIDWQAGKNELQTQKINLSHQQKINEEIILDIAPYIKKESSFSLFFKWISQYALWVGMFICIFELVLGYALLIGWKPVPVIWLMLLMILFFTFLTWYSATYNKVTDCGCFGDAIKLTPWQSFGKDIILLIMILFLFFRKRKIKPIFSPGFAYKSVITITILSFGYSIYALCYSPPVNFLNYAEGKDINELRSIPEGENETDIIEITWIYEKDGLQQEFTTENIPSKEDGWKYVDRKDKIIEPAFKPKIHDFNNLIHPEFGDITETILNNEGYQLILVVKDINKVNKKGMEKVMELSKKWIAEDGLSFWALSSSPAHELDEFHASSGALFRFASADNTLVKSISRSNPGLLLLKKGKVIKNWHGRNIPKYKQVKKKSKK